MESNDQKREGVLSGITFPTLLYSISHHERTGVLTLSNDDTEKSVYIQSGRPVFAASSDHDDRLGQIYFQAGKVTLVGLLDAVDRSTSESRRLGTILVENGYIESGDLVTGVRQQVRNIICSLFLWTRGSYRYDPGPLPSDEVITLKLNAGEIVLEGIRQIRSWERIWEAVGDLDSRYRTTDRYRDSPPNLDLIPEEWEVLTHCGEPIALKHLCNVTKLSDFETCRLLWAFRTLGVVKRI